MKIIDCIQGSPEWHEAKLGIPSASNFDKIVTTAGAKSKSCLKYLYQLAGERIIGKSEESYKNDAMLRGQEMESEARQLYELMTGKSVVQVGLCVTEGKAIYCASPDGLIEDDGALEIKCPILPTQVAYLLDGTLPMDYWQQVQGQLLVTGRKWVDFLSYYPAMEPLLIKVLPDKEFQKKLQIELELACMELEDIVKKLKKGK